VIAKALAGPAELGIGWPSTTSDRLLLARLPAPLPDRRAQDRQAFVDGSAPVRRLGHRAAIVSLGRTLKLEAVAEGIENPAQLSALCELGCQFGQGYLFSRPRPVAEMERLLVNPASVGLLADDPGAAGGLRASYARARPGPGRGSR